MPPVEIYGMMTIPESGYMIQLSSLAHVFSRSEVGELQNGETTPWITWICLRKQNKFTARFYRFSATQLLGKKNTTGKSPEKMGAV